MKKTISYALFMFTFLQPMQGQDLIIKGRIRCLNQSAHSTKGAENIVVVPTFMPSRSAVTGSSPSGYFEFNTGTNISVLQDKQVSIYIVSRCNQCKDIVKRVFISEDQDRQNKDDSKSYVTIKKWMLEKNCQEVELTAYRADSILGVVKKQPQEKLGELTNATAVVGSPALLNLLTTLATVLVPVPPATGTFTIVTLREGKINYGKFLLTSPLSHSPNTGFNFSPYRDLSESVFWNSSAMVYSGKPNNVSLITNVKNNGKLSGFFRLTNRFTLGAGAIFTMQDEFRDGDAKLDPTDPFEDPKFIDSLSMELKEYAVYLSPAFKINEKVSIGLSLKSIWQDFNNPGTITISTSSEGVTLNDFAYIPVLKQSFDVDASLTYRPTKFFQVGLNAMNLAGTNLYSDAFVPAESNPPVQNQRSFGLGLNYKWQRFNFGADLLFTEEDFYDAAIGVNYVPFNDALISAGVAIEQLSYSVALRLKHFRLAYISDNDFLVNEKRKGRSGVLNGKFYGGFSFTF